MYTNSPNNVSEEFKANKNEEKNSNELKIAKDKLIKTTNKLEIPNKSYGMNTDKHTNINASYIYLTRVRQHVTSNEHYKILNYNEYSEKSSKH